VFAAEPVSNSGLPGGPGVSDQSQRHQILQRLHLSGRTIVLRALDPEAARVILKGGRGDELRADLAARLQREHAVLARLDSDSIVRSLGVISGERGDPMLALVDIGGVPLAEAFAHDPPSLRERLDVAVALASGLGHLHERGVIHRNIAAENIVVDRAGRRVNIIGFGCAAELAIGSVLPAGAMIGRVALPYIAPEQTGRMNQPVDHRADLYSLGAVLYELFAGRPPFATGDQVELLHAHLAKQPPPPHVLAPDIPSVLGDIIMKLLMKRADDRYQRSTAVAADLARCARDLAATGTISRFSIGVTDTVPFFEPLPKLYGRRRQVEILRAALEAVRAGRNETIVIAGPAGVGKSALAAELKSMLTQDDGLPNGHLGFGKCEQSLRDSPYHGLLQAFSAVIRGVLTEPDGAVARWQAALQSELGKGAGVMCDLVPALELLIGPQPPPAPLPAAEARHRLTQAVRAFVAALAPPDCPLILVLDDAQWADDATCELLGPISAAPRAGGLMLIVIHRDDETSALDSRLVGLRAQAGGVQTLKLDALAVDDVGEILTDALQGGPRTSELASLIHTKTHGNPLFVRQFMRHLVDRGYIRRSGEPWDIDQIARVQATDNVVGFLARRIAALPDDARRLVAAGACLGMRIDVEALGAALDLDQATVRRGLDLAVIEGMLTRIDSGYAFTHDRIREAAYTLLDDRASCHRRLGAALLRRLDQGDADVSVFTTAGQLSRGGELDDDPTLKARCAEVNFLAARQARASAAFASARDHVEAGLRLTGPGAWSSQYEAIANATLLLAECHVLNRDHAAFETMFDGLLERLDDDERRLHLFRLKVLSLGARSHWPAALEAGLAALDLVGIALPLAPADAAAAIPAELAQFQHLMAGRAPRDLMDLPPLADPRLAAAMRLALQLAPSAHNAMRPELFALLAIRNANLMLRHGRDLVAPGIIMTLALTLRAITGDSPQIDALAQTAIALDRAEGGNLTAGVTFVYAYFLHHWLHPIENSLKLLLDGIRAGFEMGDIEFGSFHAATYVIHLGFSGAPLVDLVAAGRRHIEIIAGHNATATSHCELEIRFAQALLGETAAPTSLSTDGVATVAATLARGAAMVANERGYFFARSMRLCYLFGAYEDAFVYGEAFLDSLPGIAGNFIEAEGVTFFLLAALAAGRSADPRFVRERDRLRRWNALNPHNFGAMQALVDAEQARAEARASDAIRHYGDAARIADAGGYVHLSALVNERAGRHYLALGDDIAAPARLREAVALSRHWGAAAKVSALEAEFPGLAAGGGPSGPDYPAPQALSDERIDFRAVLRAAQTISRQIDLRRLPGKALAAIEESAGAEYGALVLRRPGGGFHVEVAARHGEAGDDAFNRGEPIERSDAVPRSIVAYVAHTGEPIVLDDAQRSPEFAADPYIRSRAVASVLCAPITEQGQLRGIVYLENNLAAGIFTPRRLEVVRVLAAQAAIAIANAHLFVELENAQGELRRANEGLERKVVERTAELAAARNKAIAEEEEARQARQAAEAADQAKSRFLAVVGHEIRTPMNGILGMLQMLDGGRLESQQRRYLEIAADSGKTLLSLIDGIFDYARLEAEGETLDIHDFDLNRLMSGAGELIRPQANAKQLAIELTIRPQTPLRLRGDPNRLSRVIINLLGNAVKFTPSGRIDVEVGVVPADSANGLMLHFTVADTGIGIAPEMHERIFTDFVQADDSIARRFGGTGLGLAISRRIAKLMGGTLRVESAIGAGSTFRLAVPIALAEAAGATTAASTRSMSVLVADDDPVNRTVAAGLLSRLGHRVALVDSGLAAVDAAAGADFDVVVMDLHMPRVDGIEATRRIRALPGGRHHDIPVLALTADLSRESRERCALAGINTILSKPVQFGALRRALASLAGDETRIMSPAPAYVDPTGLIDGEFLAVQQELLGSSELARLARIFQRSSLKTIAAMETEVAAGHAEPVQALAHRLRSGAGALGLTQLCDGAAAIESQARLSSREDLPRLVAALRPLRRASIEAFNAAIRRAGVRPATAS
jgi:predicted ATPase/signal transduction histidine kinase/CheY-like chemotaxis protein/HPt (histidine-containing phosphotransfer) domain-containing protein